MRLEINESSKLLASSRSFEREHPWIEVEPFLPLSLPPSPQTHRVPMHVLSHRQWWSSPGTDFRHEAQYRECPCVNFIHRQEIPPGWAGSVKEI